jgi:hypothetical protein
MHYNYLPTRYQTIDVFCSWFFHEYTAHVSVHHLTRPSETCNPDAPYQIRPWSVCALCFYQSPFCCPAPSNPVLTGELLKTAIGYTVPEIIDPVFAKTSQNARFLLSEYERFGLVFTKTRVYKFGHCSPAEQPHLYMLSIQ